MNERFENTDEDVSVQQDEEALYEIAAAEIAVHRVKKGLWAKAFAQCEGDPNRTKALYIKLRVQALKDEAARDAQQECLPVLETESQAMHGKAAATQEEWQDQSKTFLGGKTHPWRRFFARLVDGILLFALYSTIFPFGLYAAKTVFTYAVEQGVEFGKQDVVILFAIGLWGGGFLLWFLVESLFLSLFGTTPAKWLFGIRVAHSDGTLLPFSEAFSRFFRIFVQGLGFGIPAIALFTQLFAYRRLTKTGTTRWDTATNAVVFHKEWGVFRALACIACIVALFFGANLLDMLRSRLPETQAKDEEQSTQQSDEQSRSQSKQDAAQGSAQINTETDVEQLYMKASSGDAQARQALGQAAAQGNAAAQFNLGVMYYEGQGVRQDYAQARYWWEKVAAQGDVQAQYNLGLLYDQGQGVQQDYAQARSWYEKAAVQGYDSAQFNLGLMYARGQGGRQDYAQARRWYERAAAQGHAKAQNNLGVMYYEGEGVQRDYVQARRWFEKAAAKDNADAQYWMGYTYAKGHGVKQDYAQARRWFEKAAAQGSTLAQAALDMMNAEGQSVRQEQAASDAQGNVESRQALEYAAARGDAGAQFLMGLMYIAGEGVRQDYAQARHWFEKAAVQGHALAQFGLGLMYVEGQGVQQDKQAAMAWFGKACNAGLQDGCDGYQELEDEGY